MRILIADDSPFIISLLKEVLTEEGHDVETAENGIEALEKIFFDPPDIAILDVIMPYMTGYQVVRVLKNDPITKDIPVMLLTSKSDKADKFWGKHVGADYYIVKDDDVENIVRNIGEAISEVKSKRKITKKAKIKRKYSPLNILSKVNDMLDRKLYELVILTQVGRLVSKISNFNSLCEDFLNFYSEIFDYSFIMVIIDSEDGAVIISFINKELSEEKLTEIKRKLLSKMYMDTGFEGKIYRAFIFGKDNLIKDKSIPSFGEILEHQITGEENITGIIAIGASEDKMFSLDEKERFERISAYSYLVVQSAYLYRKVRELSIYDGLTEIFNRRHIMEILDKEFKLCLRYKREFSILMVDIDHFKKINDTFGHQTGDMVLKEVAYVLNNALRDVDSIGRYGGEEFLIILPNTDTAGAKKLAERLKNEVEKHKFPGAPHELKVTISIGYSHYPEEGISTVSDMIKVADCGLYRAKELGRNRVEYCNSLDKNSYSE